MHSLPIRSLQPWQVFAACSFKFVVEVMVSGWPLVSNLWLVVGKGMLLLYSCLSQHAFCRVTVTFDIATEVR